MNFDSIPTITIENSITLRGIEIGDKKAIFEIYKDENILSYTDEIVHQSEKDSENFIENELKKCREQKHLTWSIIQSSDERVIGIIRLKYFDWKNRSATIGYYFDSRVWGKGFAKLAVRAVVNYGFKKLKLHRIEAQVYAEHESSKKVLEKVGFVKEGTLKENFLIKGKFRNSNIYGIVNTAH